MSELVNNLPVAFIGFYVNATLFYSYYLTTFGKEIALKRKQPRWWESAFAVFIKATFFGILPGSFLTYFLVANFPDISWSITRLPLLAGAAITGIVIHKDILKHTHSAQKSNTVIFCIALAHFPTLLLIY